MDASTREWRLAQIEEQFEYFIKLEKCYQGAGKHFWQLHEAELQDEIHGWASRDMEFVAQFQKLFDKYSEILGDK